MRIFLSYASAQRPLAERINQLLQSEGHTVFFDREDLPAGETYGDRIRDAVDRCHVFIYLIGPASVAPGSYALTELTFAEQVPKRRAPSIVPVLAAPIPDLDKLPPFIAPLTLLEPRGDAAAEVAAKVAQIARGRAQRRWLQGAGIAAGVLLVAAGGWLMQREGAPHQPPLLPQPPVPPPVVQAPVDTRAPVAEAERVRLIGMPGNDGWLVSLDIADRQVREIFYALKDGQPFVSTGFHPHRHPATGQPLPQMQITLPGALGEPRAVSVKYTDGEGRERGPYRVSFDPKAEYVRFTKSVLGMMPWLSFNTPAGGKPLVYFTNVLSYKNAFREIRYSIDDESLSRTLPITADWSGRSPPVMRDGDVTYVEIPTVARYVAVKLLFIDGTESELKRFNTSEAGGSLGHK